MSENPQTNANLPDKAKGNLLATFALICSILSLVMCLIMAFSLLFPRGSLMWSIGLDSCLGSPAFSLAGLVAGIGGLRASRTTGQGGARALAGIKLSRIALLVVIIIVPIFYFWQMLII